MLPIHGYGIFAIGAASYDEPAGRSPLPPGSPAASDERTSTDYIALAKELIPSVYDEADIDSIRAMAIMVSNIRVAFRVSLTYI